MESISDTDCIIIECKLCHLIHFDTIDELSVKHTCIITKYFYFCVKL